MTKIHIPTPLRTYTAQNATVEVDAATVGEALDQLIARHPDLGRHLRDDAGKLRSFVNVYKGEDDVRFLQRDATPLEAGSELTIVPSIAGGR